MIRFVSIAALIGVFAGPVFADGLRFRTELSANGAWNDPGSLDAAFGFQNRTTTGASARLMWDKSIGSFLFEVHSHLSFSQGDNVTYAAAATPFSPAPAPATLFDFSSTWLSDTDTLVTNTIDRLSVTYTTPSLVLKLGRQSITWGSGMFFHPSDIVAPFAPNAIDTSYKPGADMIYAQYLFDSGADIQGIIVPRAPTLGGSVDLDFSTIAMRAQFQLASLDAGVMLARDRGDTVASVELSGPLAGASWNAEYVNWTLANGDTQPSWLFNISNFGTIGEMNIAYFAEYFHNGFGVDASVPLDSLPASLSKRMSTGQVFLPGVNFLALGANVQITPDLSITPNALISLGDRSALASLAVNYTLSDSTNLVFNYSQPIGATGTEFGGRETSAGSGIYATPARSTTLQLVQFF